MHHFRFIDVLRIVAFNLIVLHHVAFYGPMADHVRPVLPDTIDWLAGPARIVVQIFLVIAGFLAARSFCPQGVPEEIRPLRAGMRRFLKLAPPFAVAMGLAVFASMLASMWMDHYSLTAFPDWQQVFAHALLLHGVFGVESLSAGAWYVAIDFQLYLLLACMMRFAAGASTTSGRRRAALHLVVAGVGASLFYFNRDAAWDAWAVYFFGSYGFGVLAWWVVQAKDSAYRTAVMLGLIVLLGGLALEMEFRSRIALALTTALLLATVYRFGSARSVPSTLPWPAVQYLGRISYAVFLVHFPVCLLVNAAFTRFGDASAVVQGCGMLIAWLASIAAGDAFHRWIEIPLGRMVADGRPGKRTSPSAPRLTN